MELIELFLLNGRKNLTFMFVRAGRFEAQIFQLNNAYQPALCHENLVVDPFHVVRIISGALQSPILLCKRGAQESQGR